MQLIRVTEYTTTPPAIQERIDSSKVFYLPVPEKFYLISKPSNSIRICV